MRGDLSEEEMHSMAKAKFGDKFDEMGFQKGMMESKERMKRKDTFSYEHGGFERTYYMSPSYEGYSKEHMVFGMIFEHIGDDIDPREIKQYCNEPNKIADIVISRLKEKVGDLQTICAQFEEHETKCTELTKQSCSQIGTAFVREDASEIEKIQSVAYSCPVNKDAIINACNVRSQYHLKQRLENIDEECEKRFDFEGERLLKECKRFREHTICDKGKFIDRCMGGINKEDFEKKECKTSDCGPQLGMPNFLCPDGKTTEGPTGKCLRHADGRCGWEVLSCPSEKVCTQDVQQCPDGIYVKRNPKYDCKFESCPTRSPSVPCQIIECFPGYLSIKDSVTGCPKCTLPEGCPAPKCDTPPSGCWFEYGTDSKSCPICVPKCPSPQCPTVTKPTCPERQSLTTKTDDKGCIVGYECVSISTTASVIKITGKAVLNSYEDILRQCENSWLEQERICQNIDACGEDTFIEKCKAQERKNYEDFTSKVEQNCEIEIRAELKHAEQRCNRIDEDRQHCLEQSTKRCEHMKGNAQQCRESLTEENLRKFIVDEAKKRCKFIDIIQDEEDVRKSEKVEIVLAVLNTATEEDINKLGLFVDNLEEELKLQDTTVYKGTIDPNRFGDIKLLPFVVNAKISTVVSSERAKEVKLKIVARQKVEEAAGKLVSLRDSDVPSEYLYIIEDKASEVLDVSDELEEIEKKEEQKGLGYKIRLFLGLAKKAEQEEIKQLKDSNNKLSTSIEVLAKLIDEVPSDVAKAILKEQVENLKQQQEEIEVLVEVKAKKAKGWFGIFG